MADASRARLFTFQRSTEAEGLREEMIEQRDLVNPARRGRLANQLEDARPGMGRCGGLQYGLDDRGESIIQHMDAEFSRTIVGELADMMMSARAERLILCASPRMLGQLREVGADLRRGIPIIDEVPRDLVKLTPTQLRDQLASYGLLPAAPARTLSARTS